MKLNRRVALAAGAAVAAGLALFATCGGCKKSPPTGGPLAATATVSASGSAAPPPPIKSAVDDKLWAAAKDGEEEDLATLATHEGAAGLVEAATDPALRLTAIRAMGYARGWAQLPYLAGVATAGPNAEAQPALESILELAARPRKSEDNEDAVELAEGCEKLVVFARAAEKDRGRRISTVRALRMMPCPKADLPTDLDTR